MGVNKQMKGLGPGFNASITPKKGAILSPSQSGSTATNQNQVSGTKKK